jgi:hypothetical protein
MAKHGTDPVLEELVSAVNESGYAKVIDRMSFLEANPSVASLHRSV